MNSKNQDTSDIGSQNTSPDSAEGENSQATGVNGGDETNQQGESNTTDEQEGNSGTLEASKEAEKGKETDKKPEKLPVAKAKDDNQAVQKKAKEEVRLDRSWKSYQEREEARKKAEADFKTWSQAETDRIKKSVEEAEAKAKEILRKAEEAAVQRDTQFTPEQLDEFAERLEEEGRVDDAKLVKNQAKVARQKQFQAQEIQRKKQLEGLQQEAAKWDKKALEEFPELKDQNSEDFSEVKKLYLGQDDLNKLPRGLYLAATYWKEKKAASKVPELQKRISELEEQLKSTKQKLTAPAGATAASSPKTQKSGLEEASEEDLLAAFRRSQGI